MTDKNAELLREVKPVAYSVWMPMSGAMQFTTDDRVLVSNRADYVVEKLYSEATVLKMLDRIRALATTQQDATSNAEGMPEEPVIIKIWRGLQNKTVPQQEIIDHIDTLSAVAMKNAEDAKRYHYAQKHLRVGEVLRDSMAECSCDFVDMDDAAIDAAPSKDVIIKYHTSAVEIEEKLRAKLIELGWTPPHSK